MKIKLLTYSLLVLLFACKSIRPDKPTYSGEPVTLPEAISKINVPLEIPLSQIENNLNRGLKDLLYSERGLDIGNGLLTDVDIFKKGHLSLWSDGDHKLHLKLPMQLKGKINIEKEIFGQVISTAIPFDEPLVPEVSFVPQISPNWDLSIADLQIDSWGRSLTYNLMGYQIDLGPMMKKQLQSLLSKQLTGDNLIQFGLREMVQETWNAFSQPIPVRHNGVNAYLQTVPKKIRLKETITEDQKLRLVLGIEGEVLSQIGSQPATSNNPLPDLGKNEEEENYLDITLPLAIPYEHLNRYLDEHLAGRTFQIDRNTRLTPHGFETQQFGDRALVKMNFTAKRKNKKDLQGDAYLVGRPGFEASQEAIVFEDIDFDLQTKNLLANSAGWLRQKKVVAALQKHAVYPIGNYLREAQQELQQQAAMDTDFAAFQVVDPDLEVEGIYATETDIRMYLRSTGTMEVKWKE